MNQWIFHCDLYSMKSKYSNKEKEQLYSEWLVASCLAGDTPALKNLLELWQPKLYGFALNQLQDGEAAQDATQEALVSISKGIHRLKDSASFPKWAFQIVSRRCADWLRKEIRWRDKHQQISMEELDQSPAQEQDENQKDDIALLRAAMRTMQPKLSTLLRLYYLESLGVSEIAELMALPKGTVKSRLYYAREKLKKIVDNLEGE